MKFCNNCGNQLEDQATFCTNCGTAVQQEPVQQVPYQQEAYQAPATEKPAQNAVNDVVNKVTDFSKNYVKAAKKDKKLLIIPAAAVVAIIAIIVVISLIAGGGYKRPIDDMCDMMLGKASKAQIKRMLPKEAWEYLEDEADLEFNDLYDEYKDNAEDMADELEDEFGKNVKISYKVTDKDEVKKSELSDIKDEIHDTYDIKESSVKKAYEVELEMTIKGRESDIEQEMTLIVVKIGGNWYLYNALSGSLDFM